MNIDKRQFKKDLNNYICKSELFTVEDKHRILTQIKPAKRTLNIRYPLALLSSFAIIVLFFYSFYQNMDQNHADVNAVDFAAVEDSLNEYITIGSTLADVTGLLGTSYTQVEIADSDLKDHFSIRYDFSEDITFQNAEKMDFLNIELVKDKTLYGQIIVRFNKDDVIQSYSSVYRDQDGNVILSSNHLGKMHKEILE